jgi:hypothetical protein
VLVKVRVPVKLVTVLVVVRYRYEVEVDLSVDVKVVVLVVGPVVADATDCSISASPKAMLKYPLSPQSEPQLFFTIQYWPG